MHITLENLCLNYGEVTIFKNLNYRFEQGIYLIRGKSGVGKTTLLNIIMGYIQPNTGEVVKEGIRLSYMMQETMLFHNLTVRENFWMKYRLNPQMDENVFYEMIVDSMKEIGLTSELLDKKVSYLSGGQKRKVELLLLSLNESNVFLLDEPVANLDADSMKQMVSYI